MSVGITALLLLVATVTGVDGERAQIDAGLIEGLRAGDVGIVHYELTVGAETKYVEVGSAEVMEADEFGAALELRTDRPVRPGYRIRFELPAARVEPAELLRLARDRLGALPFDVVSRRMLDALLPPDPEVEERFISLIEQRRDEQGEGVAQPEPAAAPTLPMRVIVAISGGSYSVGVPIHQAKFFNQQPQFEVELRGFLIDRNPVRQRSFRLFRFDHAFPNVDPNAPATGIAFELAQAYCQSEHGRLPTEFEWQAAVESGELSTDPELLEWTASWYKAYPGNVRPERDYGEKFRVLRGAASADDPESHLRRYMDPATTNAQVGFRCVFPAAADSSGASFK